MRMILRKMLQKHGFEVVDEAENGGIGVRKYIECQPDIVTMDITMPEMTGLEALEAIRGINPKAKVVMVSAMGQEKIVVDAVMRGAQAFIVKPFIEDQVVQTLEKVLSM